MRAVALLLDSQWSPNITMMCRERRSSTPAAQLMLWALVVCAAASWVAPVSAAAAPAGGLRRLAGSGPAYWQEAARYPLHYPAAQAAAEGFVVSPMGQQPAFCNARLVKPVCADGGLWMQNRCVAELQGLSMVPDSACPPGRDVFAGERSSVLLPLAPVVGLRHRRSAEEEAAITIVPCAALMHCLPPARLPARPTTKQVCRPPQLRRAKSCTPSQSHRLT